MPSILIPYIDTGSGEAVEPDETIVVWDLDETLIHAAGSVVYYRQDLIEIIFELKALGVGNILWTRGDISHMVDSVAGTWLSWCFDDYFWDDHANDSFERHGKYKHPDYLAAKYPGAKLIIIDNEQENCSEWPNSICAGGLDPDKPATTTAAIQIFIRVAGLCSRAVSVRGD